MKIFKYHINIFEKDKEMTLNKKDSLSLDANRSIEE
jgi:hypothetical protein